MESRTISVISGASRGLGRAAAQRLATMEGQLVIATARNPADLAPLSSKLGMSGHVVETHQLDVTDDDSVKALRDWLAERFGRIDVLINNAGILVDRYSTSVLELPLDTLRETLETNLIGTLRVTQALLPLMRASRAGRVVNLASRMGQLTEMDAGAPAYRMSKTALNALTRILAVETAGSHIKVNSVCPGWCRTDLGGIEAPRTPEEGVDTVIWLATLPDDGPSGGFFRDREPIPW
ncbi:SDR family oxidoreductase [Aromatoleum diolicum]|uniref:SDR family NAD(P)-dependent oxidoreductase n=1 Tax=Aromatoleum diolicum TaxID=75796 RepID=A0ABX1Q6G6_9RHOO|nr:SDR family oxidoreductase [Aromatoleum diolicum]NMG73588.1 SDR family NAD(P)-dependent oxidoreductase [Aromatoleum diolicum]